MKAYNAIDLDEFDREFNCEINTERTLKDHNIKSLRDSLTLRTSDNYEEVGRMTTFRKKFKPMGESYSLYDFSEFQSTTRESEVKEVEGRKTIDLNTVYKYMSNPKKDDSPINIKSEIHEFTLQKLIFKKDVNSVVELLTKCSKSQDFDKLINLKDLRGNTPVMLCILLRSTERAQQYLEILSELFNFDANPKLRNLEGLTPLEVATSQEDTESVCMIYEHLLKRRNTKIKNNLNKAKLYLSAIPNFYIEMNWEVKVPLLGFLCPKDTCKIWKHNRTVRMDYTFSQFKNLSSVRKPTSFFFSEKPENGSVEVLKADHESKTYFNPFEPLEEDEKHLITKDIMSSHRIEGEFKLKKCEVSESKSYWAKKPVYETINGIKAQKYEVNITAFVNLHDQEKLDYINLNEDNYFNIDVPLNRRSTMIMDNNKLKTHIADKLRVKNDAIRNQIMKFGNKKDKKLKAYVWIAENYHIKSSDLVTLFDSLSTANEYTQKIKQFLNDSEVKKIIEKNGFPIRILIPVNFLVDVSVTFSKFKLINERDVRDKFDITSKLRRVTRKSVQNLASDNKKRLAYANIQG